MKETNEQLSPIAEYYSKKLQLHGESPQGVDWNGIESQNVRFEQLLKIVDKKTSFSINDLGCGYGALYTFLSQKKELTFEYFGIDIASSMIDAAKNRFLDSKNAYFSVSHTPEKTAQFSIASGIFNVKLEKKHLDWEIYIANTLHSLNQYSDEGFSFNCLTQYSDTEKMKDYLYYANPCEWFDYCKKNFSRNIALLHDYDLYEFTILVRKK